ncbi:MAG TPA: HsdR family type I site-specific deoxyribonuclease [Pyrinomonadaceae bacterium]|jgi:type I restriction enzyme R subunit|nr:HsdR family type I site-specific deoxyribonuclease [Pyrinomonadaceae bacterium]
MFNEANAVEDFIRDLLGGGAGVRPGLGWEYIPRDQLPRSASDALVDSHLRDALVRLNPEIAERPERADEVFYKLRAILGSVGSGGLVRANEEFAAWLRGERSMPFGENNQHTSVRLIDFENLSNNRFVVTTQFTYKAGQERRLDLVLLVNGLPLVVGEAKSPTRPAVSWVDGAAQIHDDYEANAPAVFVPNVFSFATEGKTFRFGSIRMPLENWAPWRASDDERPSGLAEVEAAVRGLLSPPVVLDILRNFTIFATDKKHRKIKIICRYQQYHTTNRVVERVVRGRIRKGLIWHFQGSGKSLLMVFAAQKLRLHPELRNPTVLIVVDRIDLDAQITATFNAADVPNTVAAGTRDELQTMLAQDVRKVIITTIHKFAEAGGVLNSRPNIVVMVDEAHRTQEGDLGRKMRDALPEAFLFGLTGTPINRRDRNTFWAFGADEDEHGYMSRYSFEESIRDRATLPLHFEARLVELRIDRPAIDEAFANITGHLTEEDQAELAKRAAKLAVLVKAPERVRTIVADIVRHYREKVEPNGFKGQVVTFDRESCVLYKQALDELMPREASDIVMTVGQGDPAEWHRKYKRRREDEEKLLDRFRDPSDPLRLLIVTSKLLTGFDAPILQAQYLDKPMKEHNLLQSICRTNRPYQNKTHGLIVDYLGIFDDVSRSLNFDEQSVQQVITNLDELKRQFPAAAAACLAYFPDVDRSVGGYEGLILAQECLPDNERRDAFAADYSVLSQLWEALSPDRFLHAYKTDYRWLSEVYESVRPPSGHGKLLWHGLGAKTVELIHENVHVEAVHDDLETLVMDDEVLSKIAELNEPKKARELEIKIVARLRRHQNNPAFVALGRQLEELKERHQRGLLTSLEFLKHLLELARRVVEAERRVDPREEQDNAKAALTELFNEVRDNNTPVMVERIVNDIDGIVRAVRYPGWQQTTGGEREVQKALRRTLLKYKLHHEQELFDRAYGYIKQYY